MFGNELFQLVHLQDVLSFTTLNNCFYNDKLEAKG